MANEVQAMRMEWGRVVFTCALVAGAFLMPQAVNAGAARKNAKDGTATAADARPHARRQAAQGEQLGRVDFAISCTPDAQKTFNTALALLHNFQYQQAEQTFSQVAQQDPTCAMAYWGKAMSLYHQLWDWPSADTLKEGYQDTIQAQKLRAQSERERMYIVAAGVFFQNNPNLSKASRIKAYSDWMGRIFTKYPDDVNAGAFYALSLITLQGKKADQDANRQQAIDILNKLMAVAPDNPGVLHYLIHAADTPQLAPQGLVAARRYAKLAPDSSHALHMPSHIFVRLGLWQEAIQSNLAAVAAAAKATQAGTADASYQFHAMDFLNYCYLQSGQAAKAQQVVADIKNVPGASADDMARVTAWLSGRNALELHDWNDAANLPTANLKPEVMDYVYFVRAIGAAHKADAAAAQQDVDQVSAAIAAQQKQSQPQGYVPAASGENLEQQEGEAWLAYAQGRNQEAIKAMLAAAKKEEAEGVDALTMPAREMLGDMLRDMKKPIEALAEYRRALAESPNRFDSLYGAAQAAQLAGRTTEARAYLAKLVKLCAVDADRPELQQARTELARK
jgi:hypothetical protein